METPRTRSRKRPPPASPSLSQEGSGVSWRRDTELLEELRAGPSKPLPLPSPTQRPRAFVASGSTGGPRKRPCRVRGATPSSTASSLGPATPVDTRRLDELLEKFDLWRTPSSTSVSAITQRTRTQPARQPLGERTNRITEARSLPDVKKPTALDRRATQSALDLPKPNPVPPLPRPLPRTRPRRVEEIDMRRPFRTPWASPKPPLGSPARLTRAQARATKPPAPPEDLPSSEGDTSVDSLDMLLGEGGEDVQDLFSMLDSF